MKLNSLAQAFSHRSDESATSHSVHKLSLGVFALEDALQQGSPFSDQKTVLLTSCSDDRLVDLAVQSLPNDISNKVDNILVLASIDSAGDIKTKGYYVYLG